jgi:hypothetical protein
VFVVGSEREGLTVHMPVERVFNPKLRETERILAFDRYWDGYDLEGTEGMRMNFKVLLFSARKCSQESRGTVSLRTSFGADATYSGGCCTAGLCSVGRDGIRTVSSAQSLQRHVISRVDIRSDAMDSRNVYVLEGNVLYSKRYNWIV